MVAVRSAHLNKAGEFDPQKWIASLGISSQQSCERLTETWAYCLRMTQGHADADLVLWRGIEMVEQRGEAAGFGPLPAGIEELQRLLGILPDECLDDLG